MHVTGNGVGRVVVTVVSKPCELVGANQRCRRPAQVPIRCKIDQVRQVLVAETAILNRCVVADAKRRSRANTGVRNEHAAQRRFWNCRKRRVARSDHLSEQGAVAGKILICQVAGEIFSRAPTHRDARALRTAVSPPFVGDVVHMIDAIAIDKRGDADCQRIVDWQRSRELHIITAPVGGGRLSVTLDLVEARAAGGDGDRAGGSRYAAEQALRTSQDFDLADVVHCGECGLGVSRNFIVVELNRRISALVGIERDAAQGGGVVAPGRVGQFKTRSQL